MTRNEFLEIDNWAELIEACEELNSDACEGVYSVIDRDDKIKSKIDSMAMAWFHDWKDIRDYLNAIPDTYEEYYILDDMENWTVATEEDFMERRQETLDWGDFLEEWDEDLNELDWDEDLNELDWDDDLSDEPEPDDDTLGEMATFFSTFFNNMK